MNLDKARRLVAARSHGACEGCGVRGQGMDPHHRKARGAGGVHGLAAAVANDVRNLLALCRRCHDTTEDGSTWRETQARGWRLTQWQEVHTTPALLHTVNGHGWWLLTDDGGYLWVDMDPAERISVAA